MDCSPPGSSVHGDSPGKNTGVSCHAFFQGIFPTQGLNPGLPHGRWILYRLSHQGSPEKMHNPPLYSLFTHYQQVWPPFQTSWRERQQDKWWKERWEAGKRQGEGGETERENINVQGKTLIIGDSPTKGRGDLIALFLHFFCIFKSFRNKNWEGEDFRAKPLKHTRPKQFSKWCVCLPTQVNWAWVQLK